MSIHGVGREEPNPNQVDRKEHKDSSVYSEARFTRVTKEGRQFTCTERVKRCALGILVTGVTFGGAYYFSPRVRNLFKKREDSTTEVIQEPLETAPKTKVPDIRDLLALKDPSEVEKNQIKKAFIKAVLNGINAVYILEAIEKHKIPLSQEEEWIKRAYTNDCKFSDTDFTALKDELKTKIYYVANAHGRVEFIQRLKLLVTHKEPRFWPGPAIIAANMDVISARDAIHNFFKDLRRDKVLLTKKEFDQLNLGKYIRKTGQINRILGLRFIERLIKENNLQYIKVPRTYLVINDGVQSLSFYIAVDLAQNGFNLALKSENRQPKCFIRAEYIESTDQKLSLAAALEFMTILEKSGYDDFRDQNVIFSNGNIYFVDTEYTNFNPLKPDFDGIKYIQNFLDPKDKAEFMKGYTKRKEKFDQEKEIREKSVAEYYAAFANPYANLANAYRDGTFTYNVDELTQQFANLNIEASNK